MSSKNKLKNPTYHSKGKQLPIKHSKLQPMQTAIHLVPAIVLPDFSAATEENACQDFVPKCLADLKWHSFVRGARPSNKKGKLLFTVKLHYVAPKTSNSSYFHITIAICVSVSSSSQIIFVYSDRGCTEK